MDAPRHQPDPRGRIHAVGSWPYTKKTGERTPEAPLAWRSPGTSQEHLAPTTEPSGTLNNARGNPAPSRRIPPSLLPPPGSQERWACLALTPPPIQVPRAATQQAQPQQQLPQQRQRRHRLRLRRVGRGHRRPCMRPVTSAARGHDVRHDSLAVNDGGPAHDAHRDHDRIASPCDGDFGPPSDANP